jgi:hypothetical protein
MWCRSCNNAASRSRRSPTWTPTRRTPQRKAELAELAGIRDLNAETLYAAMLNAPAGAVNLPLLDRASKVVDLLSDLTAIEPEDAATMMPPLRCREYAGQTAQADWWRRFTQACETRRAAETPQLAPMRPMSRPAWLNAVARGEKAMPAEERSLGPVARAALDWLREHSPATEPQIGVAIKVTSRQGLAVRLRELRAGGLVEVIGKEGRMLVYQAVGGDQ